MAATTRSFFEPRFGADFSGVRVHNDAPAAASASALNARAFTIGSDIVFGARQYSPETPAGRRLLAHELTHVVQQRGATGPKRIQRAQFGPATGGPADWSQKVGAATTSAAKAALVQQATGAAVTDITAAAKGDAKVKVSRLMAWDATTRAINYDDNLNSKKSRSGRDLSRVAGHTVNDAKSYVILGPKSLKSSDFFWTRSLLSHELDHIRQKQAGSTLTGKESEVDAWTTSFVRDFHRSYILAETSSTCYVDKIQTWTPLLEYYVSSSVSQTVKSAALKRITDYYKATVEPHAAHKLVFRFWIHRTLKRVQPAKYTALAAELNTALKLGVNAADGLGTTRQFPCGNLKTLQYQQPTVDFSAAPAPTPSPPGGAKP